MYAPPGVKTSKDLPVPDTMRAWVLGDPGELKLVDKPVPVPKRAEVLVRIDAVAICATDLEIIWHGPPASIQGGMPFNKNFTPGHEYMGTVAALGPGVDEYRIGQRVTVEIGAVEEGTALLDLHGPDRITLDPRGRVDLELAPYGFQWLRVSPPGDTRIG